jgi:hypothetical protein
MKRFSLRDLFWLILAIAILCGWALDHREKARLESAIAERDEAVRRLTIDLTGSPPSPGMFRANVE